MNEQHIPFGTLVRVHKNLNRQKQGLPDQWSVCIKVKGKGWRLHHHAETVTLTDADPIVSVKGAERIRLNQSREVVAKIEGILSDECLVADSVNTELDTVHYNPFRSDNFTYADGTTYVGSNVAYFPLQTAHFLA